MNNVNDLQHQGRDIGPKGDNHSIVREPRKQDQTVSLSYLRGEDADRQNVNINTLEMKDVAHQNTQEVRINNMPKRKVPVRRTAGPIDHSIDSRQVVDGNIVSNTININKEEQSPKDRMMTESFSALDQAVKRKKEEYHKFVEHAIAADKINRARVEDGIEEAPKEEILYRLSDIDPERAEENKDTPKRTVNDEGSISSTGEYVDDMEKELEDELSHQYNDDDFYDEDELHGDEVQSKVVMGQSYSDIDQGYTKDPIDYNDQLDDISTDNTVDTNYGEYEDNNEDVDPAETEHPQENDDDYKFDDIEIVEKKEDIKEEEKIEEDTDKSNNLSSGIRFTNIDSEISNAFKDTKLDSSSVDINDNDFIDLDLDKEEENLDNDNTTEDTAANNLSQEEIESIERKAIEHLKSEILEKVVEVGKKRFNTSSLKISNKVVTINEALRNIDKKPVRTGKFPLMRTGRPITLSSLTGLEIATLAEEINNIDRNDPFQISITPKMIDIIYKHDMNPNKPSTPKTWAKTICAYDVDCLFGAIYLSSLGGANFIPRICENRTCRYSFLEEAEDVNKYLKFNVKSTEDRYKKIMSMPDYDGDSASFETVVQIINDKYAIGFRDVPIHFFVYEASALNKEFVDKYSSILNFIAFIDSMYLITEDENGNPQLNKIGYKKYPLDDGKTLKSKIITYGKIFQEFSDTDFNIMNSYLSIFINNIYSSSAAYSWNLPETKCPKCGRTITSPELAEDFSSITLVFMKRRLEAYLTIPTEK